MKKDPTNKLYSPHHLYIHYPYCLYKCHYCDFNSFAYERSKIPQEKYTQTLIQEFENRKILFEEKGEGNFPPNTLLKSIFFGGGTPSLMSPKDIQKLLGHLQNYFCFDSQIEITLEANPGTLTQNILNDFYNAGINRLSIGVQSFQNRFLKDFGRIHTGEEAIQVIEMAQASSFENFSFDLIFGFPGQSLKEWQKDLERALQFSAPHLSCYALTVESGTQFAADLKKGLWQENTSDQLAAMQELTYAALKTAGYQIYEVSNFAKHGFESVHNQGYWSYHSYLALGAGAISNFVWADSQGVTRVKRQTNARTPENYRRFVFEKQPWFQEETVSLPDSLKEFLMMGLRVQKGIAIEDLKKLYGVNSPGFFHSSKGHFQALGYLSVNKDDLQSTEKGFYFQNTMLRKFFEDVDHCQSL